MNINAIFETVKIYNVQDRLDVVLGQTFLIEILEAVPEDLIVLTSKDPRLEVAEDDRTVKTTKIGQSLIRFMSAASILKDLHIHVVDATHPAATTLNGVLGQPVPKDQPVLKTKASK